MQLPPPRPFVPPVWARGPHVQTVLGARLFRSGPLLQRGAPGVATFTIALDDGDALAAHALEGRSDTVVALFHGLGGSAMSGYVRRTAARLQAAGHAVVAVEHRGCGAGRGLAARPYHAGCAPDLARALSVVRARHPGRRVVAVGFSLSANALLLLLGGGGEALPDAAVAVHPPVDLARAAAALRRPANRLYDLYYTRLCLGALAERGRDGHATPPARLPALAGLRDFDERFTAPLAGFRDADDYYRRASAAPHLAAITTPTVVLATRDDPYVDPAPLLERARAPALALHLEQRGGHMGYVARGRGARLAEPWLDEAVAHYVELLRAGAGGRL